MLHNRAKLQEKSYIYLGALELKLTQGNNICTMKTSTRYLLLSLLLWACILR